MHYHLISHCYVHLSSYLVEKLLTKIDRSQKVCSAELIVDAQAELILQSVMQIIPFAESL